ncbi:MAG: hypothetical protein KDA05_06940, partial [Phycisphaerales bacterium]|nr:hypothetical protein [Phycisphaerales bacterium]
MTRHRLAILALTAAAQSAHAQSVTITASHNDPDGIVAPGQLVSIRLSIAHDGFFMLGDWRGDAAASPDIGTASPAQSSTLAPSSLVSLGTPTAGSIRNVVIGATSPFFSPGPYVPFAAPDFEFMRYDWVAPAQPGTVAFDWVPDPAFPLVQGYQTALSIPLIPYPTTYLGTTLTVIPAPAAAPLLLAAA